MDEGTGEIRRLYSELNRLGDRVETQTRYTELLEAKVRELLEQAGSSVNVEIFDEIQPLEGGLCLGAHAADATPAYAAPRDRAPGQSVKLADDWWPRSGEPDRALVPNAGWRNYGIQGKAEKIVGVSVCGLPRDVLSPLLESIAQQQSKLRDFVPVFLTDTTHFDLFRRYGFVFEYLPGPDKREGYAGTKSWQTYLAERRLLLERKWGLAEVICIGPVEFGRVAQDVQAFEALPQGCPSDAADVPAADPAARAGSSAELGPESVEDAVGSKRGGRRSTAKDTVLAQVARKRGGKARGDRVSR